MLMLWHTQDRREEHEQATRWLIEAAEAGLAKAQFNLGYRLVSEADGGTGMPLGAGGRSRKADVGLVRCTALSPITYQVATFRCGPMMTTKYVF
jgi:TPR repeat protein